MNTFSEEELDLIKSYLEFNCIDPYQGPHHYYIKKNELIDRLKSHFKNILYDCEDITAGNIDFNITHLVTYIATKDESYLSEFELDPNFKQGDDLIDGISN
jgi:hypothetical protein